MSRILEYLVGLHTNSKHHELVELYNMKKSKGGIRNTPKAKMSL